jgi:hypothetical protein
LLRLQINEVTGWPVQKMTLFFAAPPESGGRPINQLFGWMPEWPWNENTDVVHLDDDLTLASYGVLKKSQRRIDADKAARDQHLARLQNDEECVASLHSLCHLRAGPHRIPLFPNLIGRILCARSAGLPYPTPL